MQGRCGSSSSTSFPNATAISNIKTIVKKFLIRRAAGGNGHLLKTDQRGMPSVQPFLVPRINRRTSSTASSSVHPLYCNGPSKRLVSFMSPGGGNCKSHRCSGCSRFR